MKQVKITLSILSFLVVFSYFFATTAEAANTETEPNDVKEKASVIQQLDEVEGTISNSTDVDFYQVTLSKQGTYRLDSILGNEISTNRNHSDSYKLKLYRSNGQLIQTSTTNGAYLDNEKFYFQTIETTLEKGTYYIEVLVTNTRTSINNEAYLLKSQFNDGTVSITSLKANATSIQPANKTIKWTATAKGAQLEYQFSVYSNKKWTIVQNYSFENTLLWKPQNPGKYKVKVTVRNTVSGKTVSKESNYTIFKPSDFSIVSFEANKKSPQARGTKMTFTAQAKGEYLEYRFRVYDGGKWQTVKNYSSTKKYTGYPYYKGKYKVAVDVRQKGTTKVKTKVITMNIKEAPSYSMYLSYYLSSNSGEFSVHNLGEGVLKINKIQLYNGKKMIYSYSPKNWSVNPDGDKTFKFTPKNKLTKFNNSTYSKVAYTYDGIKHTAELK